MTDRRCKNTNWYVAGTDGRAYSVEHIQLAVLMDIRDELQALNRLANCYRIPRALDAVIELGADARRKKRKQSEAVRKRKASKNKR